MPRVGLSHLAARFTLAVPPPWAYFDPAVKSTGVPQIRFHDLRTTYASNFVMAGGDIFALSKLLGHTSVEMTAKKYAALHPRFMKEVAETVCFNGDSSGILSLVK